MEQYYHQVVAAVLVHPMTKQVIPLAVEPILRSDGDAKNDCERNATGRLLGRSRKQHPRLKMLVIEDGLASNSPHIADLKQHKMHYLLGAKPGDHQHLFEQVIANMDEDNYRTETQQVASAKQKLAPKRATSPMYRLEHNDGHGKQNLTTVLALLMFLAFAVDQIQEACCGFFNAAVERAGRRLRLWESIRSHLRHFEFGSFADLFLAIASGRLCKPPNVTLLKPKQ